MQKWKIKKTVGGLKKKYKIKRIGKKIKYKN
jgi:hypothetical protein